VRFTQWTGTTFDLGVHYVRSERLSFGATLKDVTGAPSRTRTARARRSPTLR
jgi:hypothetical protein